MYKLFGHLLWPTCGPPQGLSQPHSITNTRTERDSDVRCQSHHTVFGYTNRIFGGMQSLVSALVGRSTASLGTAGSAFICFIYKTDTYQLMKLISLWMYFEPRVKRWSQGAYIFKFSVPCIPVDTASYIYQLNARYVYITIYLPHSSFMFRNAIHHKYE